MLKYKCLNFKLPNMFEQSKGGDVVWSLFSGLLCEQVRLLNGNAGHLLPDYYIRLSVRQSLFF